jgi:DNA-directed RNA polymerase specialized sigma24 family protein
MERLTDEQREAVAEYVPLALKLAAQWCGRRSRRLSDDVRSAFLLGLMVAVKTYDPARGASLTTHVNLKTPRAALDVLRGEWGRAGSGRAEMQKRMVRIRAGLNPVVYEMSGRAHQVPSRDPDPESRARDGDMVAAVRRNLSEAHARALLETVVGGKLIEELADEMGMEKSRLSYLRAEAVELLKMGGFMRRAFA